MKTAWAVVAAALFAVPSIASGAVMLKLETKDLTDQAEAVVLGTVTSTKAQWNEGKTKIVTLTTVKIGETVKGDLKGEVQIRTFGGEVDGLAQLVPGMPRFAKDQEVVLFLKSEDKAWHVVGLGQGKYEVVREKDKDPLVMNRLEGLSLGKKDDKGGVAIDKEKPAPVQKPLKDFLLEIKSYVKK
ncbi:MAG: hypothetical protein HY897_20620 [Deltaproteobacteria bacterium]|nr:hypothetical protein [Deltaproteobacteria bacterium]